jgi:hypothetical protein
MSLSNRIIVCLDEDLVLQTVLAPSAVVETMKQQVATFQQQNEPLCDNMSSSISFAIRSQSLLDEENSIAFNQKMKCFLVSRNHLHNANFLNAFHAGKQ